MTWFMYTLFSLLLVVIVYGVGILLWILYNVLFRGWRV